MKLFSFSPEKKTVNPFTVVYTKEKWSVALRSLFKLQKTHIHTQRGSISHATLSFFTTVYQPENQSLHPLYY